MTDTLPTRTTSLTFTSAVGMTISQHLLAHGMTRADLGKAIGLAGQNVSSRLHGKSKWGAEELFAISHLFGITVNDLMPSPDGQGGWTPAPFVAPYTQKGPDPFGTGPFREPPERIELSTYSLHGRKSQF